MTASIVVTSKAQFVHEATWVTTRWQAIVIHSLSFPLNQQLGAGKNSKKSFANFEVADGKTFNGTLFSQSDGRVQMSFTPRGTDAVGGGVERVFEPHEGLTVTTIKNDHVVTNC